MSLMSLGFRELKMRCVRSSTSVTSVGEAEECRAFHDLYRSIDCSVMRRGLMNEKE